MLVKILFKQMELNQIDNAVIDTQKAIFQEIFYFGRYKAECITIWTKDVDKINLLFELLNSLDENLKFTVEICGKSS